MSIEDAGKMERLAKGFYRRWGAKGETFTYVIIYAGHNGRMVKTALPHARTRREAEAALTAARKEADDIKARGVQPRLDLDLTIGQLIESYLSFAKEHLRQGERLESIAKPLLTFFGPDRKAISVSKSDVEKFIAWRRNNGNERTGGELRPASINRSLALLKTAYNRAVQDELLPRNPVALVKMLTEDNVRDVVLTDEEFDRLMDATPDHVKLIVLMGWETGMRRGEVEDLQWSRVDLDRGLINLRSEDCKTGMGRTIPLTEHLLDRLRLLRAEQSRQTPTDIGAGAYVFRRWDGFKWVRTGSTRTAFNSARAKVGLSHLHFHDLRHCRVTRWRDAGVSDRTVMALVGHRTLAMLLRYDHGPNEKELQAAVKAVSRPNFPKTFQTAL
jgi:integrase